MPTLLRIDSSPLGDASVSRHLTSEFVQNWKKANPNGNVITRDLSTTELKPVTGEWIGAAYTAEETRTAGQRETLAVSDVLVGELATADEYVFGVPMHNFSIPSTLKLWIDLVARAGKTFSYADGSPKGLLNGKEATILVATGSNYDPSSALASFNFVEPYLRTVLGFFGVTDVKFITAGGAAALNYGKIDRDTFLKPHVESIRAQFATV